MKVNVSKGAYIAPKVSVRHLSTEVPIAASNPDSAVINVNKETETRVGPAAKGCNIWE